MEPGKGRKGEENRKKKEAGVLSVLSCGKGVLSVLSPIKEDPEYREFWESIKKRVSLLFRRGEVSGLFKRGKGVL